MIRTNETVPVIDDPLMLNPQQHENSNSTSMVRRTQTIKEINKNTSGALLIDAKMYLKVILSNSYNEKGRCCVY